MDWGAGEVVPGPQSIVYQPFNNEVGETSVLSVHYVLLALKREEAGRGEDGWAPKLTWT